MLLFWNLPQFDDNYYHHKSRACIVGINLSTFNYEEVNASHTNISGKGLFTICKYVIIG